MSLAVLVKNKDDSTRFCVNKRKMNYITQKDPLPRRPDSVDT